MKSFHSILVLGLAHAAIAVVAAAPVPPACHAPAPDSQPVQPGIHVEDCTALDSTGIYPPSSGTHYPVWAKFKTYDQPLSRGYWMHSAEHGAVIILYNCPQGCPGDVSALQALVNSLPVDPACDATVKRRVILAPDKHLDSTFAVVAWGWRMKSNCLDTAAIRAFHAAHYAHATEDFCFDGEDFSGNRWCNEEQLGIRTKARGLAANGKNGNGPLWEGSLENRVDLVLEISSLAGVRLETVSLGHAGPGPAQARWPELPARDFRVRHPAAEAVSVRLKATGRGAVDRVLAEKIFFP